MFESPTETARRFALQAAARRLEEASERMRDGAETLHILLPAIAWSSDAAASFHRRAEEIHAEVRAIAGAVDTVRCALTRYAAGPVTPWA